MDRMSSIELALKNEETEMDFYLNEAHRSNNSLAKTMFQQLAKDEEEHMLKIRKLHEKLTSRGEWPKDVPIEVNGTTVMNILETLVQKKGSTSAHNHDDIQALEKAIQFEAQGAKFYADLASLCTQENEQKFFTLLSSIEREHHLSLTESLNYLKDPEGWTLQRERAGLDGA